MPNDYFQFKQFTIQQNKSAMKVCTDACLLGAFAAEVISKDVLLETGSEQVVSTVLDIGTGTGLLSLMVAQKTNCIIHAVEIDKHAAEQAQENVAASPWKEKINIYQTSIQEFANFQERIPKSVNAPYRYIISNPPFFNNSLSSANNQKNLAKHTAALSYAELASAINQLLSPVGYAFIMLPYEEMQLFKHEMAQQDLYPHNILNIRQTEKHDFFRSIVLFTKSKIQQVDQQELIIKSNQTYSDEFTGLLKDYYLHL